MHLGRDEPHEFWFPWVAQVAPGIRPGDMWQIGISLYLGMAKAVKK